jgi:hypothetical protein
LVGGAPWYAFEQAVRDKNRAQASGGRYPIIERISFFTFFEPFYSENLDPEIRWSTIYNTFAILLSYLSKTIF